MPFFYPYEACTEFLTVLTDASLGSWVWKICLYQNDVELDPKLTFADLVEADYGGYGAQVLTAWAPPFIDPSGRAFSKADLLEFACDGSAPDNMIYGAFVLLPGDRLGGLIPLPDGPFHMKDAIDKIFIEPVLFFGQLPQLG